MSGIISLLECGVLEGIVTTISEEDSYKPSLDGEASGQEGEK